MNDQELGQMLLQLESANLSGVPDAQQRTWQVLERDRRRVRLLTGMTFTAWLMAVGLVLFILIAYGFLMPLEAKLRMGAVPAADREKVETLNHQAFRMLSVAITGSVGVLAVAALCTLLLVRLSRQATLRQVNASLLAISEQIRQLQPSAPVQRP